MDNLVRSIPTVVLVPTMILVVGLLAYLIARALGEGREVASGLQGSGHDPRQLKNSRCLRLPKTAPLRCARIIGRSPLCPWLPGCECLCTGRAGRRSPCQTRQLLF